MIQLFLNFVIILNRIVYQPNILPKLFFGNLDFSKTVPEGNVCIKFCREFMMCLLFLLQIAQAVENILTTISVAEVELGLNESLIFLFFELFLFKLAFCKIPNHFPVAIWFGNITKHPRVMKIYRFHSIHFKAQSKLMCTLFYLAPRGLFAGICRYYVLGRHVFWVVKQLLPKH